MSLNILEYPRFLNILDFLGITWWYWPLEYSRIYRNSKLKVLPNCKLGISWIFLNIQAANTTKLLPENPTNLADSRNFKKVQGEFLESSWFVGFSGKKLAERNTGRNFLNSHFPSDCQINPALFTPLYFLLHLPHGHHTSP